MKQGSRDGKVRVYGGNLPEVAISSLKPPCFQKEGHNLLQFSRGFGQRVGVFGGEMTAIYAGNTIPSTKLHELPIGKSRQFC